MSFSGGPAEAAAVGPSLPVNAVASQAVAPAYRPCARPVIFQHAGVVASRASATPRRASPPRSAVAALSPSGGERVSLPLCRARGLQSSTMKSALKTSAPSPSPSIPVRRARSFEGSSLIEGPRVVLRQDTLTGASARSQASQRVQALQALPRNSARVLPKTVALETRDVSPVDSRRFGAFTNASPTTVNGDTRKPVATFKASARAGPLRVPCAIDAAPEMAQFLTQELQPTTRSLRARSASPPRSSSLVAPRAASPSTAALPLARVLRQDRSTSPYASRAVPSNGYEPVTVSLLPQDRSTSPYASRAVPRDGYEPVTVSLLPQVIRERSTSPFGFRSVGSNGREPARRPVQQDRSPPPSACRAVHNDGFEPAKDVLRPSQVAVTRAASTATFFPTNSNWNKTLAYELAPTRAQVPSVSGATEDLTQEVAAREVELRVLRAEVQAKEQEAMELNNKVRDAEFKLVEASGTVGALSANVETRAGNNQAVLEASVQQIEFQVVTLKRKLAQMEWELAEKDEEIAVLHQTARDTQAILRRQRTELSALQHSHDEQGHQAAQLAMDADRLQRARAVGEWRDRVQAKIIQENADVSLTRELRANEEESRRLDEEIETCRVFIARMEEKCRRQVSEVDRQKRRCDALQMEERLCISAARLGHETAEENRLSQLKEHQSLEARIRSEMSRKTSREAGSRRYAESEALALSHQSELVALTACMHEISQTLPDYKYVATK
eukprot:TRINITY_DN3471_c0_g1_i1.p1 TRINITY_DN3471_c0_g1~~TRINITY_DN3471_c0_g1_i1.p1  ORF type:complete len:731 (-),score=121.53 TRINITY_DN3471_c0_g1_i1:240-2432(-)